MDSHFFVRLTAVSVYSYRYRILMDALRGYKLAEICMSERRHAGAEITRL